MLFKRILTAIIGIPVAVYVINYGQWVFALAVSLLALIGWHEYCKAMRKKEIKTGFGSGFISIALFMACAWLGNAEEMMFVLFLITFITLLNIVASQQRFTLQDAAFTLLGINYIGILFSYLLLLRYSDSVALLTPWGSLAQGAAYMWLAFIGTWSSDTLAYFVGSQLGRHKLCPAISPGKTVEGAVGGLLGSIIGTTVFSAVLKLPLVHAIMLGILVGLAAQLGDLTESSIKRFAGVKDSGQLLPGHGGVLDRFDSILFAVPVVYYYARVFF
ncbi:MAG: phosphatidate cytidylyltransferase [Pelosinus sp.]|nr:phosphatidate cytidylyltransferase [Pelosinus sp.]